MFLRTSIALTLVALTLAAGACTSSQTAGNSNTTATFNKTTGNIYTTIDRSLDDCFEACKKAIADDMSYKIDESNKDALKGIIKSHEADNSKVSVELERKSDKVTDVEVNVGAFGNEAKARIIMDKILARLGR
jgi:hypothetical protein